MARPSDRPRRGLRRPGDGDGDERAGDDRREDEEVAPVLRRRPRPAPDRLLQPPERRCGHHAGRADRAPHPVRDRATRWCRPRRAGRAASGRRTRRSCGDRARPAGGARAHVTAGRPRARRRAARTRARADAPQTPFGEPAWTSRARSPTAPRCRPRPPLRARRRPAPGCGRAPVVPGNPTPSARAAPASSSKLRVSVPKYARLGSWMTSAAVTDASISTATPTRKRRVDGGAPSQHDEQQGQHDVGLLLDRERPVVQQRRGRLVVGRVRVVAEDEPPVGGVEHRAEHVAA